MRNSKWFENVRQENKKKWHLIFKKLTVACFSVLLNLSSRMVNQELIWHIPVQQRFKEKMSQSSAYTSWTDKSNYRLILAAWTDYISPPHMSMRGEESERGPASTGPTIRLSSTVWWYGTLSPSARRRATGESFEGHQKALSHHSWGHKGSERLFCSLWHFTLLTGRSEKTYGYLQKTCGYRGCFMWAQVAKEICAVEL